MIKLTVKHIEQAKTAHINAVVNRLKSYNKEKIAAVYAIVSNLSGIPPIDETDPWQWAVKFLSADFNTIKRWTEQESVYLSGDNTFLNMYNHLFANGSSRFVDTSKTYNAYTFLENMDIHVCPYCEDEYLSIISRKDSGDDRTAEVDHFFAKSTYPLLAMSFYNLIPSGKGCNQIKKSREIGMCPHESDIESKTALYPDIPIGINMETLDPLECKVRFHAKGDMIKNVEVFGLEERYEHTYMDVYTLLKRKQQFSRDKLDAMLGEGFEEFKQKILDEFFSQPDAEKQKFTLHNKMRRDLLQRFSS